MNRNEQCDFLIRSRARQAALCEPLCPYQKPTWWTKEVLFAFTMCATSYREKDQAPEYYVDPQKFYYAMSTFDIPQSERRDALELLTWLAHQLSQPEQDDVEEDA